ncbi:unnamed protein product, partial [Toxocara canis]|uniref:Gypsy retrotransposon integrase 1 n=1 Tax=Toxocara canis TaxID=6265 RepID=A0A183UN17_TOXCA
GSDACSTRYWSEGIHGSGKPVSSEEASQIQIATDQKIFEMFVLEQPSRQHTVTPLNREQTGRVEPNLGDDQTGRPTQARRRSQRLTTEPQRYTYDDVGS